MSAGHAHVILWLPRLVTAAALLYTTTYAGEIHAVNEMDAPSAPIQISELTSIQAESAARHPDRTEVVDQDTFAGEKGVALRPGVTSNVDSTDAAPDLVFRVRAAQTGRFVFRTHAATDEVGQEEMRQAKNKYDSMYLMIAVGDARATRRVVFVPWSDPETCRQTLGKFDLNGETQEIRIWLPAGVRLDYLEVMPYAPPKVPQAALDYEPAVVPPPSRPRIWVNAETLPKVRAGLTKPENAPFWEQVQKTASEPFEFQVDTDKEVGHNPGLEEAVTAKAFVCLMTGDEALGREAIALVRDYLAVVEFGNLLDITREIGRAIYAGAQVYDWCYDLMSPDDREAIYRGLMRLADDMEIGWPPFKQIIVNGHGAEAQVNRDLLCMAIAIYDEDPVPYRYCAYRIIEELARLRAFEYQSPRHNQGVSYGPSRFRWEMHAANLFYRMSGQRVFDDNIMDVYKSWLYMRLPNEQTFRDGDGFSDGRPANLGATPLLCYAYANDPIIKRDFQRQGGMRGEPILMLMLNDPDLQAAPDFTALPTTMDFGPILGSMVARTGWHMGSNETDVVVEMKGGGYHFGNHQHADAGSFQVYYRGLQAVDLGQYHFYGTPYDNNFNKRSVAHSMLLVVDPDETFRATTSNDGGARNVRSCPTTPEQVMEDPTFLNGTVLSADFGPSRQRPFYSTFAVDLTSAYSDKIEHYVRTFCFLNLGDAQTPAALIVLDNVTAADPSFRKYWQVNTLNPPEVTADGAILRNTDLELSGKVTVKMLQPPADARTVQVLSGKDAYTVSGQYFPPPRPDRPEANGHRVRFFPTEENANDVFLTVMVMSVEDAPDLPVEVAELPDAFVLNLADRTVVLSRTGKMLDAALQFTVPDGEARQLLLTGLAPGDWSITSQDGTVQYNARVDEGRNSAFFLVPGDTYSIRPEPIPDAPDFAAPDSFMPPL